MATRSNTEILEALASEIGENVYIDIAKWHLYLSNAHLHTVVAEQVFPMLSEGSLEENKVVQVLKNIPVKIGGGKREIPLADLLPMQCQVNLMDILEKFQDRL